VQYVQLQVTVILMNPAILSGTHLETVGLGYSGRLKDSDLKDLLQQDS